VANTRSEYMYGRSNRIRVGIEISKNKKQEQNGMTRVFWKCFPFSKCFFAKRVEFVFDVGSRK